ncbi:MAG: hypothetical protein ACRCYP_04660 [Alphaproteobacteria bacterium]
MDTKLHEINGKKFIINQDPSMTHVEEYRVGDQVMVLKKHYGDDYKTYPGVIVGFHEFKELPTIQVAYLNVDYSSAKIEFLGFNEKTKDAEFCRYTGDDLPFGKARVLDLLGGEIEKKEQELRDARHKQQYFLECFGRFFTSTNKEVV